MISTGRYDPNFDAILHIPVQELIIDKHLLKRIQVVNCSLTVDQECLLIHLYVWRAPAYDKE
jgi:hypothetical protein